MDASASSTVGPAEGSEWVQIRSGAAHLSAGVWAGLLSGLIIGGLGGRLAMGVLRVTSDPSLTGRVTDDGFKIGIVSGSTLFLVLFCGALGLIGGLLYLVIRGWLPNAHRGVYAAIVGGAVGGALVIKPDGIDFTLVEPLALSIPMFIALPALYGWSVSAVTERLLTRKESSLGAAAAFLPLLGLALIGPFGVIVLALGFMGWMLIHRVPSLSTVWTNNMVVAFGRVALAGVTLVSLVALTKDILEIV
jgi:hypothetical protein